MLEPHLDILFVSLHIDNRQPTLISTNSGKEAIKLDIPKK